MRTLFLLTGAPGSGKSALIDRLGIRDLTLGYDQFRALFSVPFPCADADRPDQVSETLRITAQSENDVISAAHNALKARMRAGTTVFFDITAIRVSEHSKIAKMAAGHGYATHLVDCQGDLGLEELLERDRARGLNRVGDEVVAKMHGERDPDNVSRFVSGVIDGRAPVDEVRAEIAALAAMKVVKPAGRTIVVGDVHSCSEALDEAIAELDAPDAHWIFVGDLFDRGPDPVGVWRTVTRLIAEGRAVVVTGNHEVNLRSVNTHVADAAFTNTRATRDELLAAGIMAGEQTAFVNATLPVLYLDVTRDQSTERWLVTHGGVGASTLAKIEAEGLLRVSDAECVYGISDRPKAYRGKTSYDVVNMPLVGFQLHGHRNGRAGEEPVEAITCDALGRPIVCLEGGVSAGGDLVVAVFDPGAPLRIVRFDDRVDAALVARNSMLPWKREKTPPVDPTDATALLERMRESEHVNVRRVEGAADVVACNFTKRAFVDGAWDELTVHARGLFIDEATGKIAARGYEKFFHLGEAPGRTRADWADERVTAYPVAMRKKFNGYLALVASIGGELQVFSKSGVTPYSRFALELLEKSIGETGMTQLAEMLARTNCTAAFEVLAARDTHPVAEGGPDRLVLLDCIRNEVEFATHDAIRTGVAKRFGFESAEVVETIAEPEELFAALERAAARLDEGVVIVDAKGYRGKIKAEVYADRKAARTALTRVWSGKSDTLGQKHRALELELVAAGILPRIDEYTAVGIDGVPRLDLARVFDDLDASK